MKKDTTFSIRISRTDLETIRRKAKQARMSQSDYVTHCCLGKQIIIVDGLTELLGELRTIGNNINRLTILANMGRVKVSSLDETVKKLSKLWDAVRELGRR